MLLLILAVAFAPAIARSQDAPIFHANTRLVQINVIARDKDGPVTNLTQSDFNLTDHGKPRTISVFSIHQATPATMPLPLLNTFSNRPRGAETSSAVTMILLDRLNTMIGSSAPGERSATFDGDLALANAKQHLLKFIDGLRPNDSVAIYVLGTSLGVLSDFTNDRARLKTILENYKATSISTREVADPLAVNVCPPGSPDGCPMNRGIQSDRQILAGLSNGARAQTTMTALMALAAHVSGIPGRKNLVWLTADLALAPEAAGRALSVSNIAVYPVDARGLLPVAMERSGGSASSQPMGTEAAAKMGISGGPANQPIGTSTMQILAEATGGRAFTTTNDLTGAVREAIEDGSVTYTLGFYLDADSLDGKFHELKVRVKQARVHLRTQRGYFADKAAPSNGAPLALPVSSPLESSAIHLLARVEHAGTALSISGSLDLRDLQMEQTGDKTTGTVEIHLVQQDAAGKVLDGKYQTMHLQLTRADYDADLKTGVAFRGIVEPKNGLTTLRILAVDPARATVGSLIVPVSEIK